MDGDLLTLLQAMLLQSLDMGRRRNEWKELLHDL